MVELQIINKTVIPANAGVILANDELKHAGYRYPRECGGDPDVAEVRSIGPKSI